MDKTITEKVAEELIKLKDDESVKAVVLRVNSREEALSLQNKSETGGAGAKESEANRCIHGRCSCIGRILYLVPPAKLLPNAIRLQARSVFLVCSPI